MLKTILVGVSPRSSTCQYAFEAAIEFLKGDDKILAVFCPGKEDLTQKILTTAQLRPNTSATSIEEFKDVYQSLVDELGPHRAKFIIRPPSKDPKEDLIKVCMEYNANILVLGQKPSKAGVIEAAIQRPTIDHAIANAPCNVMIIKRHPDFVYESEALPKLEIDLEKTL